MKRAEYYRSYVGTLLWLLAVLLLTTSSAVAGKMSMGSNAEQTFPLLQTKTGTYTNVTVTKKTKEWIFILHSQGVCNIKATDLSTDARVALGYEEAPQTAAEAAKDGSAPRRAHPPLAELAKLEMAHVKEFAAGWRTNRKEKVAEARSFLASNPQVTFILLCILAVVYTFISVCFWSICRKTHIAPGPLVWVPFLQLIPLLRAANMPRVWFFAYFIPIINIIAMIMLSINIVKTRGKNPWVAFLLIVPLTTPFAFLYLAMSRSAPVEMVTNEILSLETA
ncbi:MAG TPA: DUF5684 domain-containing protein [Verrucomicrobiae bacterium]|jgi:hypothetical protein|nr:DUF5684 domain-containing protein [Verrucomicrobiae bacterium]